jgi:c-di-GMP-binding flagellar brake protein YcgR
MIELDEDRRYDRRIKLERPCKVYEPRLEKYFSATMNDFSAGGMHLTIPRTLDLKPDDRLLVGVAQKRRQVLLRSQEMITVRVARCMHGADGCTYLGVELIDRTQSQPEATRLAA